MKLKHAIVLGASLTLVAGFGLGAQFGSWAARHSTYVAGLADGVDMTERQWQLHMKTHCVCWFNDSRCNAPRPIVVCKFPEPLKKATHENTRN